MNTCAVLTISDSSFHGTRADLSGPAVVRALEAVGFKVVETSIVPDEREQIEEHLIRCCGEAKLVVTVGGTGMAQRDVTPEATLAVADRLVPGIPERMRAEGARKTPMAALSRAVCGIRDTSMILNLPGSPTAAVESLLAVVGILPHALDLLGGKTAH
ncbi:MAG TPA: MogA/MoaB family molybdenum cofactor biosynthesis protein [Candidatus Angelobacter sp.]|nr:MogA/MoaB family molybdenum cofactor biosynthesis protein [Candidatus Angelobacter sp.]